MSPWEPQAGGNGGSLTAPVTITATGTATGLSINAAEQAMRVVQTTDWAGAIHDVWDVLRASSGDTAYMVDAGGLPGTTATGVNALNSSTVNVGDTSLFPASGSFRLSGSGASLGVYAVVTYTGKTLTSFTGCGNHAATVGGEPITVNLTPGGMASVNVIIPNQTPADRTALGSYTDGWSEGTPNTYAEQVGLLIQAQTPFCHPLQVASWSNYYGIQVTAQNPSHSTGTTGGGVYIADYSTASGLKISKLTAPVSGSAALKIQSGAGATITAILVLDDSSHENFKVTTDGVAQTLATFRSFNGYTIYQDSSFASLLGTMLAGTSPGGGHVMQLQAASGKPVMLQAVDNATIPLVIAGLASQSADLVNILDSSNNTLVQIDKNGTTSWYTGGSATLKADPGGKFFRGGGLTNYANTGAYLNWVSGAKTLSLLSRTTGDVTFVVQGFAAQTADLAQWQDSTPTTHMAVTAAGLLKWSAAADIQTTVGAAGGASALPATPTKYLKVVGSDGTTYVIPAYAAL